MAEDGGRYRELILFGEKTMSALSHRLMICLTVAILLPLVLFVESSEQRSGKIKTAT